MKKPEKANLLDVDGNGIQPLFNAMQMALKYTMCMRMGIDGNGGQAATVCWAMTTRHGLIVNSNLDKWFHA